MAYHFLSIESVKLKIKDKAKGPKQIYGEIKLRAYVGHCFYIYHRHGHEAGPVPEDDEDEDGFPLTLCGPNRCIDPDDADDIKVLYEKGPKPFFSTEFSLKLRPETRGPMCLPFDLPDDMGTLYVRYTWVISSLPAQFQFLVIKDGETLAADLSVWGTIIAKQVFAAGLTPNLITIFRTRAGPVIVPSGESIPLPRSTFIVPVRSHSRAKGHYHPKEGFIEIDVDLQAVRQDAGEELSSIKGKCIVFLYTDDKLKQPRFFVVEDTSLKRKEPGVSTDGLQLKISVTPFHEYYPKGEIDYLEHA